jgi:hypothetical protein
MGKQISLKLDGVVKQIAHVNPVFARHETFHPRFGWIKKGYDIARENTDVFVREDVPVRLGVGKNMAGAIRYWCHAFKILENDSPSEFGDRLLADKGWDPFLEDPASLWLLHWNLLKPTCTATAWYFAFNIFSKIEFSQDEFFHALCDYRDSIAPRIVDSSVRKDVTCIIRMYVQQVSSKVGISEETIDCPFTALGIIHTAGDTRHYTFKTSSKNNFPPEIIVSACLEYASWVGQEQRTISIARLLYDISSPGMVFKLSESDICDAIEKVARWSTSVDISYSAGLVQFSFTKEPEELAKYILDEYYTLRRSRAIR